MVIIQKKIGEGKLILKSMEKEIKAKQIFDAYQNLKSLQQTTSGIDLIKAKELAYIKKDKNYKIIMGDDGATWASFIAQPELQPLKVSKADRLVKIYNTYILNLGLTEEDILGIDSNILQRLTTLVDDKNINEWLNKAKNLSRSDFYRELKYGEVNEMTCEHQWNIKEIKTCKICGAKEYNK